jgi:hypothetical protein
MEGGDGTDASMTDEAVSSEDALSDLARERRALAERQSARPRPSYVVGVDHSEAGYTLDPSAIPLSELDAGEFCESLNRTFGLELAPIDYGPLLNVIPRDQLLAMDEAAVLQKLITVRGSVLKFENGRFPLRNDFVPIRSMDVNFESVIVRVGGVTEVAEAVAQDVVDLMWKLSGSTKRWKDLESAVLLVGYATATRVQLSFPAEQLVSAALMDTLSGNLTQGINVAKRIGYETGPAKKGFSDNFVAIATLEDLTLEVSKFNPATGASNQSNLRFSVTARNDHGTGRIRVVSELKYEDHIALLNEIMSAFDVAD